MAGLHNTTRSHTAPDAIESVILAANRVVAALSAWQFRIRSRRQLAHMDDHQLRDIGIDRFTRNAEVAKPFWQE